MARGVEEQGERYRSGYACVSYAGRGEGGVSRGAQGLRSCDMEYVMLRPHTEGWPALPLHLQVTNPSAPAWSTQGT